MPTKAYCIDRAQQVARETRQPVFVVHDPEDGWHWATLEAYEALYVHLEILAHYDEYGHRGQCDDFNAMA